MVIPPPRQADLEVLLPAPSLQAFTNQTALNETLIPTGAGWGVASTDGAGLYNSSLQRLPAKFSVAQSNAPWNLDRLDQKNLPLDGQ